MKKRLLDAVYMGCAVGGAALVASNTGHQLVGYSLFLVSSTIAHILLMSSNASRSLVYVNAMFAAINIMGILRA